MATWSPPTSQGFAGNSQAPGFAVTRNPQRRSRLANPQLPTVGEAALCCDRTGVMCTSFPRGGSRGVQPRGTSPAVEGQSTVLSVLVCLLLGGVQTPAPHENAQNVSPSARVDGVHHLSSTTGTTENDRLSPSGDCPSLVFITTPQSTDIGDPVLGTSSLEEPLDLLLWLSPMSSVIEEGGDDRLTGKITLWSRAHLGCETQSSYRRR